MTACRSTKTVSGYLHNDYMLFDKVWNSHNGIYVFVDYSHKKVKGFEYWVYKSKFNIKYRLIDEFKGYWVSQGKMPLYNDTVSIVAQTDWGQTPSTSAMLCVRHNEEQIFGYYDFKDKLHGSNVFTNLNWNALKAWYKYYLSTNGYNTLYDTNEMTENYYNVTRKLLLGGTKGIYDVIQEAQVKDYLCSIPISTFETIIIVLQKGEIVSYKSIAFETPYFMYYVW